MVKTIKNTKTKQKPKNLQNQAIEHKVEVLKNILIETNQGIVDISKTGAILAKKQQADFEYLENIQKIQDEYVEYGFKMFKIMFVVFALFTIIVGAFTANSIDNLKTRLAQVEATYENSRCN